jgi:hypothetical protein
MRRHAEERSDSFCARPAFVSQVIEGLELVGGMHVFASNIFVQADLIRIVGGIDDTADRLGLLDLLPSPKQYQIGSRSELMHWVSDYRLHLSQI